MRRGFTLIEIVVTLVVASLLAVGTFRALEALYQHTARSQAVTRLSLQSQIVLDQLSVLLYSRIPNSAIGYRSDEAGAPSCEALAEALYGHKILEWLALDDDGLVRGDYDGFVDMARSDSGNGLETNTTARSDSDRYNLVFAGAFDRGDERIRACRGAYGWHGQDSDLSYDIDIQDGSIAITDATPPLYIYEKYYLSTGAYAVARAADIDTGASCFTELNATLGGTLDANALLLFSDYRPWKGETFCADPGSDGSPEGNVTLLAPDVVAFRAEHRNGVIRLSLEMNQSIRGSQSPVHISKQKAVF
jgi:prepilin-type N-terminal cleavage/methylation domain-containing protein